jgi:hypothetical protein
MAVAAYLSNAEDLKQRKKLKKLLKKLKLKKK